MFTLYIHILEVLAMNAEGARVKKIAEMGCGWSYQQINSALRELEKEGYVMRHEEGKTITWTILEKSREYCERIANLYSASHIMDDIADHVASIENAETPREQSVVEVMIEEQPNRLYKVWSPRKALVIHAAHHAKRHKLTSWIAIEEVIQEWQQNNINQKSRDYYAGLSHQAQLRLISDVKNYRA